MPRPPQITAPAGADRQPALGPAGGMQPRPASPHRLQATPVDMAVPHRASGSSSIPPRQAGPAGPGLQARRLATLVERQGLSLAEGLDTLGLLHSQTLDLGHAAWRDPLQGRPAALQVAHALLDQHEPDPLRYVLRGQYDLIGRVCTALACADLGADDRMRLIRRMATRPDSGPLLQLAEPHVQDPQVRRELGLAVAGHSWRISLTDVCTFAGDALAATLQQQALRLQPCHIQGAADIAERLVGDGGLDPRQLSILHAHSARLAARLHEERGIPLARLHQTLLDAYEPFEISMDSDPAFTQDFASRLDLQSPFPALLERAEHTPEPHREDQVTWVLRTGYTLGPQGAQTLERLTPTLEWLGRQRPPAARESLTRALTDSIHTFGAASFLRLAGAGQFHRPHMTGFAILLHRLYADDAAGIPGTLHKVLSHSRLKDAKRLPGVHTALQRIAETPLLAPADRRRLVEMAVPAHTQTPAETLDGFITTLKLLGITLARLEGAPGDQATGTRQRLQRAGSPQEVESLARQLLRELTPGHLVAQSSQRSDLQQNWLRYMQNSRQPDALIVYQQTLRGTAPASDGSDSDTDSDTEAGDTRQDVIHAVDLLADAVIWSADSKEAFARLRYDTQASSHLAHIAAKAPAAWAAWRKAVLPGPNDGLAASAAAAPVDVMTYLRRRIVQDRHVPAATYPNLERVLTGEQAAGEALRHTAPASDERLLLQVLHTDTGHAERSRVLAQLIERLPADSQFQRDLQDLRTLCRPTASTAALHIVDTDAAEDLLLCGTEVTGSCQRVDGSPSLNMALMGYVMDGKYRMLAAKNDAGQIAARRMLRLLHDDNGMPVLHLERLYANAGVGEGGQVDAALVALARAKASALGCAILWDPDTATTSGHQRQHRAHSIDSRAPCEYVDSERLGVTGGRYMLRAQRLA